MRRKLLVVCALVGLTLLLAQVAAANNAGFTPVAPSSPNASQISTEYYLILGITAAIFLLVEGLLVVFVVRFRSRGRARTVDGAQVHGNTRLEIIWTVVPVLILAAIAGFVFSQLSSITRVPQARAAGGRLDVDVVAHQFYWEFRYPNGVIQIDGMPVPAHRVVALHVSSVDVDHSWWIPALGGKIDAIPGQTNETWFRAEKVGTFDGQCAEFCGIQHAKMLASVQVLPQARFARWLAAEGKRQVTPGLGKEEYVGVCSKCHELSGPKLIGPDLGGNPLLKDRTGLTNLLRNGQGQMPAVGKDWTEGQITALLGYLKTNVVTKGGASGGQG